MVKGKICDYIIKQDMLLSLHDIHTFFETLFHDHWHDILKTVLIAQSCSNEVTNPNSADAIFDLQNSLDS